MNDYFIESYVNLYARAVTLCIFVIILVVVMFTCNIDVKAALIFNEQI